MNSDKYSETIRIILLARPADTLCSGAVKFFFHRHEAFFLCTNPYELALKLEQDTASVLTILMTRPSMMTKQIADYLRSHQQNLCLIGWLDHQENPTDSAFSAASDLVTMMISRFEQLANVLKMLDRIIHNNTRVRDINRIKQLPLPHSARALLSDDELNAILEIV